MSCVYTNRSPCYDSRASPRSAVARKPGARASALDPPGRPLKVICYSYSNIVCSYCISFYWYCTFVLHTCVIL